MNIQTESNLLPIRTEQPTLTTTYEAPAIEAVVTLEELEREVHYAGSPSGIVTK